jgi:hypothetical protein
MSIQSLFDAKLGRLIAIALSLAAIGFFQPNGLGLTVGNQPQQIQAEGISGRTIEPHSVQPFSQPLFPSHFLLAQRSRVRRIQFAPGKSSATLEDAVIRGTRDIYLLGASKGQSMTVKIASVENNASFAITTPANPSGLRRTLTPDAVTWNDVLPTSGDYQLIVGSSRGNASYKLQVTIR